MSTPLDPFRLPAATTSRFLLLIAVVTGAGAASADLLSGDFQAWERRYVECAVTADRAVPAAGLLTDADSAAHVASFLDCYRGVSTMRTYVGLAGAAAVVAVIAVAYAVYPRVSRRRRGMFELRPGSYPAADREIRAVLAEPGTPALNWRVLVNPFRDTPAGRAFGHRRAARLGLNRGLVREGADPAVLRAVLRHEIAHWTNRDVTLTALTVVSGWPLVALALVLCARMLGWAGAGAWPLIWRWAAVIALLLAVRAAVMRAREHYADVRAAGANTAAGDEPFLPEAFPGPARRGPFGRLFAYHPSTEDREAVVRAPQRLFDASFGDSFAAGLTVGILWGYVLLTVSNITVIDRFHTDEVTTLVLAPLIVWVTAAALWRATLRATSLGQPLPDGLRPGLGLGAGLLAGQLIAPAQTSPWLRLMAVRHDYAMAAVSGLVLVALCLLFTRWCVAAAAAWLTAGGVHGRRAAHLVATVAVAAGLTAWSGQTVSLNNGAPPLDGLYALIYDLQQPSMWIPLIVAAVFPVLAGRRALWPVVAGLAAGALELVVPGGLLAPAVRVLSPVAGAFALEASLAIAALPVVLYVRRADPLLTVPVVAATCWLWMAGAAVAGRLKPCDGASCDGRALLDALGSAASTCAVVALVAGAAALMSRRPAAPPADGRGAAVLAGLLTVVLAVPALLTETPATDPAAALRYAQAAEARFGALTAAVPLTTACADWSDATQRASLTADQSAERRLTVASELMRTGSGTLRRIGYTLGTAIMRGDDHAATEAETAADYFCADVALVTPP